ncbi:uncharacterized protein LOC106083981 [Stomoxys calcitrans]|uniref:uncharacterized protein LOC106083981 n=1 Tax=Stomoxys calcitrans TaxID=35570 RepID=UPI0027E25DD8|nr:uncharacterized protein LOC106083981 [Stomoxys calcitrans]XP_059225470.1 uncharacterized protein LOC106083981 [Stomoxys calcitrans]XP_059225507.1 uncharacterized protein LOC106083981 [Stomoxys calcitrans]XP_059225539.1 uncharacterized protein LOC106083981 [Stomoxys calcitrans]
MFERPPIWVVIVGLNVCVLIWLITVQEPVMYDASTSIISSGNNNNINLNQGSAVTTLQHAGGRADRDIKEAPDVGRHHRPFGEFAALTLNSSSNASIAFANSNNRTDELVGGSTTNAIDLSSSLDLHSLTSSLGTGVLKAKQKPTPSWIKTTAVSSALPEEDFNQLIDLHDFHYIVPQPVCSSDIEALILVHSAPRNNEKRQIIRETWASIGHHMVESPLRVLFLLGYVNDDALQWDIYKENSQFGDVIQGSFVDDYRNMTYKHVMAFKWFLYNCATAQILIKVDDDVYVNTPQLMKYLKDESQQQQQQESGERPSIQEDEQESEYNPTIITLDDTTKTTTTTIKSTNKNSIFDTLKNYAKSLIEPPSESSQSSTTSKNSKFIPSAELFQRPQNLLFCQKIIGSMVKRSYRSKWRVSFKEYSERYYPPYCPGYAIIYSPDVVFRLYTAAQKFKYFWIDDVHITGVLAQQTNTTITTSSHYVLYSDECERLLTGKTDLKDMEFLFAWHSISPQQVKAIWQLQMLSLPPTPYDDPQHYRKRRKRKKTRRRQQNLTGRVAYNISNYITPEGFR